MPQLPYVRTKAFYNLELELKLGISTRSLYEFIVFMKKELNALIIYVKQQQYYDYSTK